MFVNHWLKFDHSVSDICIESAEMKPALSNCEVKLRNLLISMEVADIKIVSCCGKTFFKRF